MIHISILSVVNPSFSPSSPYTELQPKPSLEMPASFSSKSSEEPRNRSHKWSDSVLSGKALRTKQAKWVRSTGISVASGETAAWVHSSVMATTSYWFLIVAPHLASDVCILGVRLEVSDCSRTFAPGRLKVRTRGSDLSA